MTARRSLVVVAALALGPVPACLHVSGTVAPPPEPPAPRRGDFASMPSKPGEVVRANPTAPPPAELPATVSRRPATTPAAPLDPPPEPDALPAPVTAVKAEPGPFPLPALAPKPASDEPPLVAAMRAYAEKRPYDALHHLEGLDRANQEFVLQVLPLLAQGAGLTPGGADAQQLGVMADQFRAVAARLDARAALRVEKLAVCKLVDGFGRYVPHPLAEAHKPGSRTVVYLELDHVVCEAAPGPRGEGHQTRVQVTLRMQDSGGRPYDHAFPHPKDPTRRVPAHTVEHAVPAWSAVQDYYQAYGIAVPHQPGVYYLTAEARELGTGRTARSQPVEFRVAGQ